MSHLKAPYLRPTVANYQGLPGYVRVFAVVVGLLSTVAVSARATTDFQLAADHNADSVAAQDSVKIQGTVRAVNGQAISTGHLMVLGFQPPGVEYYGLRQFDQLDSSGRFSFKVPAAPGYYLRVKALHHETYVAPLLLEREDKKVTIELAPARLDRSSDSVRIVGAFNEYRPDSGAVSMERRKDGSYVSQQVPVGDSLAYQIAGIETSGIPIAGSSADRYIVKKGNTRGFDRLGLVQGNATGNYIAVLDSVPAQEPIDFQPKVIPKAVSGPRLFASSKATERIARIHWSTRALWEQMMSDYRSQKAVSSHPDQVERDWSIVLSAISDSLDEAKSPLAYQYWLINYFYTQSSTDTVTTRDRQWAREAVSAIPPESPLWFLEYVWTDNVMRGIGRSLEDPDQLASYALRIADHQQRAPLQAAALYTATEILYSDPPSKSFIKVYTRLTEDLAHTSQAKRAEKQFASSRKIQVGNGVPDFELTRMSDSSKTVSKDQLQGRVYLLDFWGTWCGPCIAQMDELHQAYRQYQGEGLEFVSIAMHDTRGAISRFRNNQWEMPWLHVFIPRGSEEERQLKQKFEITGFPRPILVGQDGTIIATDDELRGTKLDSTLKSVLNNSN